ncbi:MAG: hypothetical protein AAF710_09235 [Planctomycetota bacterium]
MTFLQPHRSRLVAGLAAAAFTLPLLLAAPSAAADHHRFSCGHAKKSYGYQHHDHYHARTHHRGYHDRHRHHGWGDRHHHRGHSYGYHRRVWVPPVYRTRYGSCGRKFQVIVRHGYYRTVFVAGHRGGCRY